MECDDVLLHGKMKSHFLISFRVNARTFLYPDLQFSGEQMPTYETGSKSEQKASGIISVFMFGLAKGPVACEWVYMKRAGGLSTTQDPGPNSVGQLTLPVSTIKRLLVWQYPIRPTPGHKAGRKLPYRR